MKYNPYGICPECNTDWSHIVGTRRYTKLCAMVDRETDRVMHWECPTCRMKIADRDILFGVPNTDFSHQKESEVEKLPLYEHNRPCAKCGCKNVHTQYIDYLDQVKRRCVRCNYTWNERPLDTATPEELRLSVEQKEKS